MMMRLLIGLALASGLAMQSACAFIPTNSSIHPYPKHWPAQHSGPMTIESLEGTYACWESAEDALGPYLTLNLGQVLFDDEKLECDRARIEVSGSASLHVSAFQGDTKLSEFDLTLKENCDLEGNRLLLRSRAKTRARTGLWEIGTTWKSLGLDEQGNLILQFGGEGIGGFLGLVTVADSALWSRHRRLAERPTLAEAGQGPLAGGEPPAGTALRDNIFIAGVSGSMKSFDWRIGNDEFRGILEASLKSAGLLAAAPGGGRYALSAAIVHVGRTTVLQYSLTDTKSGEEVLGGYVSGVMPPLKPDSLFGFKWLRTAQEGAVQDATDKIVAKLLEMSAPR